jgi:hypothetical protein
MKIGEDVTAFINPKAGWDSYRKGSNLVFLFPYLGKVISVGGKKYPYVSLWIYALDKLVRVRPSQIEKK